MNEYRAAINHLARSDTGRFQLLVVRFVDGEESELTHFPRLHGSWRLSASEAMANTRVTDPRRGSVEVDHRLVDGRGFVRVAFEGSLFGKACWVDADPSAPQLAGTWFAAGLPLGLASALHLFDRYRPGATLGASKAASCRASLPPVGNAPI